MTDENNLQKNDSGKDEKSADAAKEDSQAGNHADIPAHTPKSEDGAIKVFEYNPLLLLLVNGVEENYRYMKLERIRDAGDGKTEIVLPPQVTGPTGFQRTSYQIVTLYLPIHEFRARLRTGSLEADFRRDCIPPPVDPRIGIKMDDGTLYAGKVNGKDFYAAPHDARGFLRRHLTKKFKKAARYIDKLNKEKYLGHDDWRMPTYRELEKLCENQDRNSLKGTFDQSPCKLDGLYWSSTPVAGSPVYKWSLRFDDGYHSSSFHKDRLHIRAVRG